MQQAYDFLIEEIAVAFTGGRNHGVRQLPGIRATQNAHDLKQEYGNNQS